jgi:uncharacterized membrane protein
MIKARPKFVLEFVSSGCFILILFVVLALVWIALIVPELGLLFSSVILLPVILVYIFRKALRAHTLQGKIMVDKVAGFKMFLSATERERLKIMHKELPMTLETFERFLPYAIALDIEPAWSEQFKDAIAAAAKQQEGHYVPVWYHTSSFGSGFDSNAFSGSFSGSISSSSQAPGSSSGFGGGGGSGGGGGGGGGGGW